MKTYAEKMWGDCSKAVAYQLNFVQLCYGYGTDCYDDYYDLCPKCGYAITQNKDYEYPKGTFSKKDYYILDTYDYGVSKELAEYMFCFGVSKDNFRPIFTRKHDVTLGYQITPVYTLKPIGEMNGEKRKLKCKSCNRYEYEYPDNLVAYNKLGYPVYISDEVLKQIEKYQITRTYEQGDVIISLELYNYLLNRCPRIECRPVFLGSVTDDVEYIRLRK